MGAFFLGIFRSFLCSLETIVLHLLQRLKAVKTFQEANSTISSKLHK